MFMPHAMESLHLCEVLGTIKVLGKLCNLRDVFVTLL